MAGHNKWAPKHTAAERERIDRIKARLLEEMEREKLREAAQQPPPEKP